MNEISPTIKASNILRYLGYGNFLEYEGYSLTILKGSQLVCKAKKYVGDIANAEDIYLPFSMDIDTLLHWADTMSEEEYITCVATISLKATRRHQ